MKKTDINDVIEYVRAGEDDPVMERVLQISPDGQELLKQARFICAVLQDQSASSGEGDVTAVYNSRGGRGAGRVRQDFKRVRSHGEDSGDMPELEEPVRFRRNAKMTPSILDRIDYTGVASEELGTLEFAAKGEMLFASYQPSKAVLMRPSKQSGMAGIAWDGGKRIVIQGRDVTLTIDRSIVAGQPAWIRVARGIKKIPARHLGVVFMPDSGPFLRVETDGRGVAELPTLDQSGTIRIETPIPQLLHINYKK